MREILMAENVKGPNVQQIVAVANERGVPVRTVDRARIEQLADFDGHQGVAAFVRPVDYTPLDVLLRRVEKGNRFFVVAAGIEDPHNLGAIVRTANGAGADGVIVGKHRAAGLSDTVMKASAGAALYTPVVRVTNIADTLDLLKSEGCWVYGASSQFTQSYWDVDWAGDVVIVVGSEGKGIPDRVQDKCDFHVAIPMHGSVSSLNASVAGALLMYEVRRARTRLADPDGPGAGSPPSSP